MKVSLFVLSIVPLMCIVALMCGYLPICFEEGASFVGFDILWQKNIVTIVGLLFSLLVGYSVLWFLKRQFNNNAPELSETVESVTNKNYDTLNFVASYFVPLVSFQFCDDLKYWLILCFIIYILFSISQNSDMYYNNPVLILLKFRIYEVSVKKQCSDNTEKKIIISREVINKGDLVKCVSLSNNIYYANVWKKEI